MLPDRAQFAHQNIQNLKTASERAFYVIGNILAYLLIGLFAGQFVFQTRQSNLRSARGWGDLIGFVAEMKPSIAKNRRTLSVGSEED